jgi:hypothetical protein
MTVGGVDTYYDYEDKQWKHRRLGGGPVRRTPVCPAPESKESQDASREERRHGLQRLSDSERGDPAHA